jgi:hypothetical protein
MCQTREESWCCRCSLQGAGECAVGGTAASTACFSCWVHTAVVPCVQVFDTAVVLALLQAPARAVYQGQLQHRVDVTAGSAANLQGEGLPTINRGPA